MLKRYLFVLVALIFVTVSVGQASEWAFDKAHSSIGFKVKHLMITNVHGSFDTFDGKVIYDPADPGKAMVSATIDAASINTANEKRDEHLRSADFFDVATYPQLTFKSKSVSKTEDGLKITGDLTLHGVTKEVTLKVDEMSAPVQSPMGDTRIGATAHTKIDRTEFGLTWNKALETGGLLVDNLVKIELEIQLIKK